MVEADERQTLYAFLDYLRGCVAAKASDVPESTGRREVVPSGTSVYWLVSHLTAVEINLFQRILDGRAEEALVPPRPSLEGDRLDFALARYQVACAESRSIAESFPDLGVRGRGVERRTGQPRTVRWIFIHAIEETARHAGHLDILCEQLDGRTGR
ncbi:MAG TPA: DUF664 domain-containing protein [Acidimicrobiales bacterium]|nr:DUF664 domain-containing protein [Acidimicrobiales bacterium]